MMHNFERAHSLVWGVVCVAFAALLLVGAFFNPILIFFSGLMFGLGLMLLSEYKNE